MKYWFILELFAGSLLVVILAGYMRFDSSW
jgi:hypothetical protein